MSHAIEKSPGLIRVTYGGTLTVEDVQSVVDNALKAEAIEYIDRIEDIRGVNAINLGFKELMDFARSLQKVNMPTPVKTAILTRGALQYGIARMFQTIIDYPMMKIEVFSDEEKALEWLSSDK